MVNLTVPFSDGVIASICKVQIKEHYSGLIEARPGALSRFAIDEDLPRIHQRIEEIKAGRQKGRYCLEPALMDEKEFWGSRSDSNPHYANLGKCFKDFDVETELKVFDDAGIYTVTIEFSLSKAELLSDTIPDLIEHNLSSLAFNDIKQYCLFLDYGDC